MPLFMFLLWTLSVSLLCLSWVPPPLLVPLYLYPLLFRPLFALLRHIRGRRCLLRYRRGRYHLEFDGSALTGHLTRDELRLFKQELSRCTRHAMRQRKTLIIESHLLTDWRQKELRRALPHDSLIRYSLYPTRFVGNTAAERIRRLCHELGHAVCQNGSQAATAHCRRHLETLGGAVALESGSGRRRLY